MKKSTLVLICIFNIIATSLVVLLSIFAAKVYQNSREKVNKQETKVTEVSDLPALVKKVSPAVVSIVAREKDFDSWGHNFENNIEDAIGSGFIVKNDGLIVTSNHVVENMDMDYYVVLESGDYIKVEEILREPEYDIALIRVNKKDLPVLELANSDELQVGQSVIAIGNSLGDLPNTASAGIISGKHRVVTTGGYFSKKQVTYSDMIQTDAALNPGNSGGPLINMYGKVVGINTAAGFFVDNVGFAIPSNKVLFFIESLDKNGKIVKPYIGIKYAMGVTTSGTSAQVTAEAAFVLEVAPQSPADKAGLKKDSRIYSINGQTINAKNTIDDMLLKFKPGDTIEMEVHDVTDKPKDPRRKIKVVLGSN